MMFATWVGVDVCIRLGLSKVYDFFKNQPGRYNGKAMVSVGDRNAGSSTPMLVYRRVVNA